MDATTTFDWITKGVSLTGGMIGAIGGTLGIITTVRARRKETDARLEDENNFNMLAAFMAKQKDVSGMVWHPEIGSDEWKRAEKLVERRILERGPAGRGYCLPYTFVR